MSDKFVFFWKTQERYGCFSNWYYSSFKYKGLHMATSEHGMMYEKAMLFNDQETAKEILNAKTPADAKALGRKVKNFDKDTWEINCKHYVYDVCKQKFIQNPKLLTLLYETKGKELVEASPKDFIWGIGLSAEDPRALDKSSWKGTNWLGEVLTKLRDDLLEGKI